jgi:hypothetical protein
MKIWTISGACRNVGKTHLAKKLSNTLPNAVYAKIGHSPRKNSRQTNYFTSTEEFFTSLKMLKHHQHCIVESNKLSLEKRADIGIFIDANDSHLDIRPDRDDLKAAADIVIDNCTSKDNWHQPLTKIVTQHEIENIILLLSQQRDFLFQ